jgi:hypothetical protein
MAAVTNIQTPIVCKICGKGFPVPPGVILDTTKANERLAGFVQKLAVHLKERHRDQQLNAAMAGAELTGMLTLMNFDLSGEIETQRDFLRWRIHNATTRARVTNERIEQRSREILASYFTAEEIDERMRAGIGRDICRALGDLRDVLTEAGRYEMKDPAAAEQEPAPVA